MEKFTQNIRDFLAGDVVRFLLSLLFAVIVVCIGFRLIRLCMRAFDRSRLASRMDPTAHSFVRSLFSIALKLLLMVTIAGIVGIPTASIIAVLGSASVAIGLAMQGSLSNLAGGVMILLFKPFVQDDFIEVANVEAGRVADISIFYTTLVTVDNRRIVVPNGTVSNASVTNYTSQPKRRLDVAFSVEYAADSGHVRDVILSIASGREKIDRDPAPAVVLKMMGDSSVLYELRAWCDNDDYWNERFAIIELVKKRFQAEGIGIPFPQMDVHVV